MRPDPNDFRCWRDPEHKVVNTSVYGWPFCMTCRAAPPFHERREYLHANFAVALYVPTDWRGNAIIAKRAGIVGLPNEAVDSADGDDGWVNLYFEGWVNGAMQYEGSTPRQLWEAGVYHAADRMVTDYPTIARAHLPQSALRYIGIYRPKGGTFDVHDNEALEEWLS
ncbi:MAG: hypothetical protein HOV97_05690 [Nonomuraea sp.]|nr:hypothetical protein [Nonomuraea sp.]